MDKKQETQEIAQLCCYVGNTIGGCPYNCRYFNKLAGCGNPDLNNTAKRLFNAGYRKAEEVRKETLKEILDEVGGVFIGFDEVENEELYARDFSWYKDLCANHGVDLSEQIRK